MTEYSQGILGDGAAILKDGVPMTIEEIVEELRANNLMPRAWQTTVEFIADCADREGLTDEDPVTIGLWPKDAEGEKTFRGLIRYTVGDFRALKEEIEHPQPDSPEEP